MNKNTLYIVVIALLLVCVVFLGFDKLVGQNDSNSVSSKNVLDSFVGKYASSEYDEKKLDSLDKYTYLEIKNDGTAVYKYVFNEGDGESVSGKVAISDDKIYIFNSTCSAVVVGNSCDYPNCEPIVELNYNGNKITDERNTNLNKIN